MLHKPRELYIVQPSRFKHRPILRFAIVIALNGVAIAIFQDFWREVERGGGGLKVSMEWLIR